MTNFVDTFGAHGHRVFCCGIVCEVCKKMCADCSQADFDPIQLEVCYLDLFGGLCHGFDNGYMTLPCRDDCFTVSFGIRKNSGPPAECKGFDIFKIIGDQKSTQ